MNNYKVQNLTPFVPAKDYELSRRFYKDFGFKEVVTLEIGTRFEIDNYGFWLQNYYYVHCIKIIFSLIFIEDK